MAFGRQNARRSAHVLGYVEVFGFAVFAPMHLALAMHRMMQIALMVDALAKVAWVLPTFGKVKLSILAGVLHSYKISNERSHSK